MLGALILIPALSHFLLRSESEPRRAAEAEAGLPAGRSAAAPDESLTARESVRDLRGNTQVEGCPTPANVYP
jgi:hypothetical protein